MNINTLTRQDTTVLKGIGIMLIVLHNWCHAVPFVVAKDGERCHRIGSVQAFWSSLFHLDYPFFNAMSYLGWLAICIFMFATGYGLVRKYEDQNITYNLKSFWGDYVKLLRLLVIGIIGWALLSLYEMLPELTIKTVVEFFCHHAARVIRQLLMITNLMFTRFHTGIYAPWWYFSLTLQFYAIYVVLNKFKYKWLLFALAVSSLLLTELFVLTDDIAKLVYVRYNSFGWMIPFVFGIYIARYGCPTIKWQIYIFAMIGLFLSDLSKYTWCFQPLCFLVSAYACMRAFSRLKINMPTIRGACEWLGGVSSYIFVVHPIIRQAFFDIQGRTAMGLVPYVMVTIFIAWIIKMINNKITGVILFRNRRRHVLKQEK